MPAPKASRPGESKKTRVAKFVAPAVESDAIVLDRLFAVVESRRDADPNISHSARLLSRGPAKVAQKFGEEAVECLIEAVTGNRDALIAESADVLYHLLVLWVSSGVDPGRGLGRTDPPRRHQRHRREGRPGQTPGGAAQGRDVENSVDRRAPCRPFSNIRSPRRSAADPFGP